MAKRVSTKIGDVFCVNIDNKCKRYFQYIANDLEQLNSSVIRIFKTHYPIDHESIIEILIKDEVEFFAHTVLKVGITTESWYKIGNSKDIGTLKDIIFRSSRDFGDPQVKISERWYIWHINEASQYIGVLSKEYQNTERGEIIPYIGIIERLTHGKYMNVYPGY